MRAARLKEKGGDFQIEDIDKPEIDSDEVLLNVKSASLCGTDLDYYLGESDPAKYPATLGHEGAGVVESVGDDVNSISTGDRIIPHYVLSCGQCKHCFHGNDNRCRERRTLGHEGGGTFADYMKIPAENAFVIDDSISFEVGSITGCAVATAYHAVNRANPNPGDQVVIFGVGGVGIHAVLWSKFFGAGKVIAVDLIKEKLQNAEDYGADVTVDPETDDLEEIVDNHTDGYGASASIECSGSPVAMEQALEVITGKNKHETGTVVSVGGQYEPITAEYWGLREGWLTTSGDHTAKDLHEIITILESGRIDLSDSISHVIGLEEINDGLELLKNEDDVRRIVIDMEN